MHPHEQLLVETYASRPFVLVGVNSDRDRDAIRATVAARGLTWRSFWDGGSTEGPIASAWNVRGWPTIYLIDHEGVLRHRDLRGEDLDAAIAELVERAEAAGE